MKIPAIILGIIGIVVAIWIGGPMTGIEILATVWLRAALIAAILLPILIVGLVRTIRRRRAAREIEEALTAPEAAGDGDVLAKRMSEALATLRKSGGKSYLYDLPWFVIIGPPGAGKTTALANSGLEFPLKGSAGGAVEGFGGTRYCDWWFTEEAILIDTAGRYTTQDSDKTADSTSWQSFLSLLKRSRPKQPINGVIL
ncbi:MAG: type VI secretion system membrane subunit TssM, partial [Rubellimicrobium sp.]|nr:type VI secretion system membrane subunit TssM [Rubellimicrobium sp.]